MIGQTVSHYKIVSKIGQGGMGEVYLAEDTRLDRRVALKFLAPELARDHESLIRFRNEAKAAAELSHPNIATIHDIGEVDGKPFLVLEYLEGQTLKERVAQGPLPIEDVLRIGKALAAGLAEAHSHGIIHRDIKSANVMLTEKGEVKILDFGLAHRADATQITREGTTLGTIGYMSPEQARGERADERSDIWSLGVVLHECLTGRLPFTGAGAAMIEQIKAADVPPPTALRSGIPLALESAIMRCLEKDPQARLQDAEDLIAALNAADSSSHDPLAPQRERRSSPIRNPWFLGAAVLVILAVAAVFGLRGVESTPDSGPPRLAVIGFTQLEAQPDPIASEGLVALLNAGLAVAQEYRVVSPEYLRQILHSEGFDDETSEISLTVAREADATHVLTGELQSGQSTQRITWRIVESKNGAIVETGVAEAPGLSELAALVTRDVSDQMSALVSTAAQRELSSIRLMGSDNPLAFQHYSAGMLASRQGRREPARDHFLAAVELDSSFALAHYELSWVCNSNYERELARRSVAAAIRHADRLGRKERMLAQAHQHMLHIELAQSIDAYEEILSHWPDSRRALVGRTDTQFYQHAWRPALKSAVEGLRYYPEEPDLIDTQIASLFQLGRWESALQLVRDQSDSRDYITELHVAILARMGNFGEAEAVIHARVGRDDPSSGLSSTDAGTAHDLAFCSYGRGNLDEAIRLVESALSDSNLTIGERHKLTLSVGWMGYRGFLADAGRVQEAGQPDPRIQWYGMNFVDELVYAGQPMAALSGLNSIMDRKAELHNLRLAQLWSSEWQTRIWAVTGRLEDAEAEYGRASDLLNNDRDMYRGWVLVHLLTGAQLTLAQGDGAGAIRLLDELDREGFVRCGTGEVLTHEARARAYEMTGELDRAITTLEELTRVFGGRTLAHFQLGKLYEKAGRVDEARARYEFCLELWHNADDEYPYPDMVRERLSTLDH